jgi:hypothetical protein
MRTLFSLILIICATSLNAAIAQETDELLRAILDGDEGTAVALINDTDQVQNLRKTDPNGMTYLMHASQTGKPTIVNILLVRGANIYSVSANGQTSLHYAVLSGDQATVEMLLNNGADPNIRSASNLSPSDLAYQKGFMEINALLSNSISGASPYGNGYGDTQSDGRTYFNLIIQDPNKVTRFLSENTDITKLMTDMKKTATSERSLWLSKRVDRKTGLASALKKQVDLELKAIIDTAKMEQAKDTYADANEYASYFTRRMAYLTDMLKEQSRLAARAARSSATSSRGSRRGGSRGGRQSETAGGQPAVQMMRPQTMRPQMTMQQQQPPQNNEFSDLDASWGGTTSNTDHWDLCLAENEKILDEYGLFYNAADKEKAEKVKGVVAAIVIARNNRLFEIQNMLEKRRIREANTMQTNPAAGTTGRGARRTRR